jgi:Cdc6-like AAA superfamily ATPase
MEKIAKPKGLSDWLNLEFEVGNLFTSGPIDEDRLFAGRASQVRTLLETVFDRSKHAILFGERGVGKTSLSNVFWKRYGKSLQTLVAVRVQADPSDNFSSLWIKGLEELKSFAVNAGRGDLIPIETNYEQVSPDMVRRELQKCRPNAIPIIIIDEFDKLKDHAAKELTANLIKSLSDYSVTTTVVLVGVAENVNELVQDHKSIRRPLTQVRLERMSDLELNEILDTRLKFLPLRLEGDARWKIAKLARGLPFYVHMLGKYSFQNCVTERRFVVTDEDVDKAMDRFIGESQQSYYDDYYKATTSNQTETQFKEVLLACALAKTDDSGFFPATNVIAPLSKIMKKPIRHGNFQRHLIEFVSEGRGSILIRRGEERQYRYRFHDPMMQPYIIMKGIREKMVDDETRSALSYREQPELPIDD